jgi:Type ISP C-terminal specificity domain
MGPNLGLSTARKIDVAGGWEHVFCSSIPIQHHTVSLKEVNYLFPLYLYPEGLFQSDADPLNRSANLAVEFTKPLTAGLTLALASTARGDLQHTVGPEDVSTTSTRSYIAQVTEIDTRSSLEVISHAYH